MNNLFRTILVLTFFTLLTGCGASETAYDKKVKAHVQNYFDNSKEVLEYKQNLEKEYGPEVNKIKMSVLSAFPVDEEINVRYDEKDKIFYTIKYRYLVKGKPIDHETFLELEERGGDLHSVGHPDVTNDSRYIVNASSFLDDFTHDIQIHFKDEAAAIATEKVIAERAAAIAAAKVAAATEKKEVELFVKNFFDHSTKMPGYRRDIENKYRVPMTKGKYILLGATTVPHSERHSGERSKTLYTIKYEHIVGGATFTHEAVLSFRKARTRYGEDTNKVDNFYFKRGVGFGDALTLDAEALLKSN